VAAGGATLGGSAVSPAAAGARVSPLGHDEVRLNQSGL